MSKFNPEKLSTEFKDGVAAAEPIVPRLYTLTHSDITAELFLTIGKRYAFDKITSLRDEVLGKWSGNKDGYLYVVNLHLDDDFNPIKTPIRNLIFERELPLALEAIRYGDRAFFSAHPELDAAPIIVHFNSSSPKFNKIENWGTFLKYKTKFLV